MKKFYLAFILISSISFAQMPNINKVWLNNGKNYFGTLENKGLKTNLMLKINISDQNKKNDQEYFISGTTEKNGHIENIEGSIKIEKYKDGKKESKIFGTYEIAEQPDGNSSGLYKGNFVFSFKWNDKTQETENKQLSFTGTWTNYENKEIYQTSWSSKSE